MELEKKYEVKSAFDDHHLWKTQYITNEKNQGGIFRIPGLLSEKDLKKYSSIVIQKCMALKSEIAKIQKGNDARNSKEIIDLLDQISDNLCSLLDMCEFIRNSVPSQTYVEAADEAIDFVGVFMNDLNTDSSLHSALVSVLENQEIASQLSNEALQVGNLFKTDFELSGINLSQNIKDRFIKLSSDINEYGIRFQRLSTTYDTDSIKVGNTLSDFGFPDHITYRLKKYNQLNNIPLDCYPMEPFAIQSGLALIGKEETRKKLYIAENTPTKYQNFALSNLLRSRFELAKLLGYSSYSEMQMKNKMFKDPDQIGAFLWDLGAQVREKALVELKTLQDLKNRFSSTPEVVEEWDRSIFVNSHRATKEKFDPDSIVGYLTPGELFNGVNALLQKLFNVKLVVGKCNRTELWDYNVRKLYVVHEQEGLLGTIYCDIFGRGSKAPNACHYTIRCRKNRSIVKDTPIMENCVWGPKDIFTAEEIREMKIDERSKVQLPIVVVSCSTLLNDRDVLTLNEMETIMHELGHALHSVLSNTDYHNASGTRCQIDFVEIPSAIFENFIKDPRTLDYIIKNSGSVKQFPISVLEKASNISDFSNMELLDQIQLSIFDLECHSNLDLLKEKGLDISKDDFQNEIYNNIKAKLGIFPVHKAFSSPARFSHLNGYGGSYYTYLVSQGLSKAIWDAKFKNDPLDQSASEEYRNKILLFGGSVDPYFAIQEYLGEDPFETFKRSFQ